MKNVTLCVSMVLLAMAGSAMTSCSEEESLASLGELEADDSFGKGNEVFNAEEWYPGGEKGTTTKASYSAIAPGAENEFEISFNKGEDYFSHLYTYTDEPRKGLGPAWVRSSCIHCHPSYGHGRRQSEYKANTIGNGYLLVVYHPDAEYTTDGVRYTTNNSSYISEVTGMPQTKAMEPFKAPIDEDQISINWKKVTSMPSGLALTFPDGEAYELIYPEVTIPASAFSTNPVPTNYEVRLESTIGLYGTGLLDAITEEDMKAQWAAEAPYVELNPNMWNKASNDWATSAWYTLVDGTKAIKRFTYAMTRASLQDGAGANAIWNITNVTRSDRKYLYSTPAWAKAQSEDSEVIKYIRENGKSASSLVHAFYADTDEGIAEKVNTYLSMNSASKGADGKYEAAFGEPEMSDKDYYDFMVWHRGLAVPAARNLNDAKVKRGKQVFNEIGCAQCHRPSWTTGPDNYWVDNSIKAYAAANKLNANNILPRFPYQKIWPYTDMVQHRLYMENDIRTGWCRTTPLWGRGLSLRLTGAQDRLHDCRARNEVEAIMWHGYSKQSDGYAATVKFFNLSKEDRDAVVLFLKSI